MEGARQSQLAHSCAVNANLIMLNQTSLWSMAKLKLCNVVAGGR